MLLSALAHAPGERDSWGLCMRGSGCNSSYTVQESPRYGVMENELTIVTRELHNFASGLLC
jgi:hypothetical protein